MTDSHVFLCHSSFDKPSVCQLYRRLLADGFNPWLDEEGLLPGQDWESEIRAAIRDSRAVIVCLSRESISKTGFVQREIRIALDAADERPEGSIYIIPAKLEDCQAPQRLARWHWVDLHKDDGYERLRQALLTMAPHDRSIATPPVSRPNSVTPSGVPAHAPSAGVTSEIISWQDADVRFDGLYVRKEDRYSHYLRFRPSGTCHTASTTGPLEQVSRWLGVPPEKVPIVGPYTILGDQVRIITKSSSGRVEYRGTIGPSANELHLYLHSYINGHESFGVWRFHRVQFPN